MTPPRFPFWHMTAIAAWFASACFTVLFIWAGLYLSKPVTFGDVAWLAWCVAGLVWSALLFDRYTFAREHLMAENKLARANLGLLACAEVWRDRIARGVLVYGTPLHKVARERKRRALDALRAAEVFRDRRDGAA